MLQNLLKSKTLSLVSTLSFLLAQSELSLAKERSILTLNPSCVKSFCINECISFSFANATKCTQFVSLKKNNQDVIKPIAVEAGTIVTNKRLKITEPGQFELSSTSTASITFSVDTPVVITQQPGPPLQTVTVGSTVTYTVIATGGDLTYQWQLSTDGGVTFNDIAGATSASYTTPPLQLSDNGNHYRVIVCNACGCVASDPVEVLVISGPTIQIDVCSPDPLTLEALNATSYQWLQNGNLIPNNNNQPLVIANVSALPGATPFTLQTNTTAGIVSQTIVVKPIKCQPTLVAKKAARRCIAIDCFDCIRKKNR